MFFTLCSMSAALRRTPEEGFAALRLIGLGRTDARSAASRRVSADALLPKCRRAAASAP
jgi:hypothetical protein